MSSRWIDFVKDWASKHNLTYGCALSNPECSADYKKKYPKPPTKKQPTDGKGIGKSKIKVVDEYDNIISVEPKTQKKKKGKRSIIDAIVAPFVSDRVRDIQIEDEAKKKRKGKVYIQPIPINGKGGGPSKILIDEANKIDEEELNEKIKKRLIASNLDGETLYNDYFTGKIDVIDKNKYYKNLSRIEKLAYQKAAEKNPDILDDALEDAIVRMIRTPAPPPPSGTLRKRYIDEILRKKYGIPYEREKKGKGILKNIRKGLNKAGKKTRETFEDIGKTTKLGVNQAVGFAEKAGEEVAEYGKAVIYGRMDYPPKVRAILKKYGEEVIVGYKIKRTPVSSLLTSALSAVSLGKFGARFGRSEYDDLFHLFLEMNTASGKRISVEKNEVINMEVSPPTRDKEQVKNITTNIPNGLTINTLMANTERYMGKKNFYGYSARDNNCQDFIVAILKSNNIGDTQDAAFVKQDTKSLFKDLPFLRKFSNTITDIGARANVITTGAGLEADYITQSVVFSKDKWTTPKAKKWLKENGYIRSKVDKTENTLRFRQIDPTEAEQKGFTEYRTKDLSDSGIQFILSYKKKVLTNNIRPMTRFVKGSEEAKEWGRMMREKRMAGGSVKKLAVMNEDKLCPHCQSPMVEGGKININKQFKKAGKATKQYVTAKKGGLATDVIKYGIPAASSALLGGLATAATGGNPVAGVAASALGSKLGSMGAAELQKATGTGMRKGRFVKGSPEAIAWGKAMREKRIKNE